MTDFHIVGERIQQERRRRNLTQAEFALQVGYSQATVSNWERGQASVPGPARPRIKELLGIDMMLVTAEAMGLVTRVETAIHLDPDLTPEARVALMAVYRELTKRKHFDYPEMS